MSEHLYATIGAIEYHLPDKAVSNAELAAQYPEWSAEKIGDKTGIQSRHVANPDECSSDLALRAAEKLFESDAVKREEIDFLLLCTQSPDYFLPTTSCVLQHRLGLPTTCGAFDFNLGCSGFVYGLGIAKGLIETGQASKVLLLTAETYTKFIHPLDRSVRTIFGDAAAATLVQGTTAMSLGPFIHGTDGRGANNLIVPTGGVRNHRTEETAVAVPDGSGNVRSKDNLYMNGTEIFTFTLRAVPSAIQALLDKSGVALEAIDLFVFHQANTFMLEALRKKVSIPEEKFYIHMSDCGNTVSSTIPIALHHARMDGRLKPRMRVLLIGFGVGYSWSATLWQA